MKIILGFNRRRGHSPALANVPSERRFVRSGAVFARVSLRDGATTCPHRTTCGLAIDMKSSFSKFAFAIGRPGGYSGAAAPDPIPNSAVKRPSAYDTSSQDAGKSVAARSANRKNVKSSSPNQAKRPARITSGGAFCVAGRCRPHLRVPTIRAGQQSLWDHGNGGRRVMGADAASGGGFGGFAWLLPW